MNEGGTEETVTPATAEGVWSVHANNSLENKI